MSGEKTNHDSQVLRTPNSIMEEAEMIGSSSASMLAPGMRRERTRGVFSSNLKLWIKLGVTIVFLAIAIAMLLPEQLYHFRAAAQGAPGTVKGFPYSTPITLNNA